MPIKEKIGLLSLAKFYKSPFFSIEKPRRVLFTLQSGFFRSSFAPQST